jgi:internalin A
MGRNLLSNQVTAIAAGFQDSLYITGPEVADFFELLKSESGSLSALKDLSLRGCDLWTVPESIGSLTALTTLNISHNKLTRLPESLGNLTALNTLFLHNNRLTTLPETVGHLSDLTTLLLCHNQFTSLPQALGKLYALEKLHLHVNLITHIPESIGSLVKLNELTLSHNQLTMLPESIGNMSALRTLSLHKNRLVTLPDSIGRLASLEALWLNDNRLVSLPASLQQLRDLRLLFLHGNDHLGLPPQVLGPSAREFDEDDQQPVNPADVLDYYFATRGGARELREVKLILVGWGDVGKSTLAQALQGRQFKKGRRPTDGIEISRWPVKLNDGDATIRIWDFGGQEIMHGTHQFFLTKRAIYVVMVKGRDNRGSRDAEYWLKHVRAFGGDSTVLLVMNRQEETKFDLDRNDLATKYGVQVPHFFRTECSDQETIAPVIKAVRSIVRTMLDKQEKFPGKWWPIKTELEGMKCDCLSDSAYRQICSKHGVTDQAEQSRLLDVLNDLGIIVHFADDALADLKVLDPEWATDGVYRVITNEALRDEKQGKLRFSKLKEILPMDRWPEKEHRQYVIDLMLRFDLCFPAEGENNVYFVSDLLPEKTPDLSAWDPKTCVVFRYKYPVLPHGILPRFISKSHTMSEGKHRWRSGVVVANDGAEALVRADYDANVVDVWVRGGHKDARRALLTIIRNKFAEIHSRFKELHPEERIAAPGYPAALVAYRDLILDQRRGKTELAVTIDNERRDVLIADMLDGMASPQEHQAAAERFALVGHVTRWMRGEGDLNMTFNDNRVQVGGNVINSQVGQTLTNCTNMVNQQAAGTKKAQMDTLRRDVEELIKSLPPVKADEAQQVAENLELALKQAAKDKPDRKWYSVSAEGLMEAATWVEGFTGKIGGAIKNLGTSLFPNFEMPKLHQ